MMNQRMRVLILGAATLAAGISVALLPRTPQPLDYHNFADQRTILSIPNFFEVVSNVPFLLVGIWGLLIVLGRSKSSPHAFVAPAERWPYVILASGVILTCFGSAYYHRAPDNAWLVWDRLPMTLGFMSLLAAMIMERLSLRAGLALLGPLLVLGLLSVLQWYVSELHGAGDLRLYLMVQFYTLVLVLLILWLFPPATPAERTFWLPWDSTCWRKLWRRLTGPSSTWVISSADTP